jgi:hypothetical protein
VTRVQIPAYTDRWMMGDRYGVVTNVFTKDGKKIAHVRLDKSGKTIRVILDDCNEV